VSYLVVLKAITRKRLLLSKHLLWRLVLLCVLLILAIGFNLLLVVLAPPIDNPVSVFVTFWLVSFLPYLAACLLVLVLRPLDGRWRWLELGMILLGAFILRAIFLPLLPDLSHDSWRYLWDAHVTLHGYSPYVYIPGDPALIHLRNVVFDNSRYRDVPTLYPPGAQAIYLLSYLIAPDNLLVLKSIFSGLDLVTCGALAFLLQSRGLDPARCIIYAWCPLPILEFALQGHHEAITLAFTMLAFTSALGTWRGSRVLTGFLLAMATLTNIYPILFLVVLLRRGDNPHKCGRKGQSDRKGQGERKDQGDRKSRPICVKLSEGQGDRKGRGKGQGDRKSRPYYTTTRLAKPVYSRGRACPCPAEGYHLLLCLLSMCRRDWALLATCFATLILAYVPYALLGHGQVFGFFATYASEQSPNAGSVLLLIRWLGERLALHRSMILTLGYCVDLLLVSGAALGILWLRWHKLISIEAAALILIGTIFAVSTHLYPWYNTALLPWLALLIEPLWTRQNGLSGKGMAAVITWYFACISITWYFFFFSTSPAWNMYYLLVYALTLAGLGLAALLGFMKMN
jgi:hypothetical protein